MTLYIVPSVEGQTEQGCVERLLQLNPERYAEEVRQGLHEKKKPAKGGRARGKPAKAKNNEPGLFGNAD